MPEYSRICNRIEALLQNIDSRKDAPLSDVANTYRVVTEAICKAVIVSTGSTPSGDLNSLVQQAGKAIDLREGQRDGSLFRASATYLRNLGNILSHDSGSSNSSLSYDQNILTPHLITIIRVAFFGECDRDPPKIPAYIESCFPTRLLRRNDFEEIRSEQVVRLCYPRQSTSTEFSRRENSKGLFYDYVSVSLGGGLIRGFLFLRSRSAVERCISDLLSLFNRRYPDSLSIVTPRIFRADGGYVDRKKSIGEILNSIPSSYLATKNPDIIYFDEFVWENCLPEKFRHIEDIDIDQPHFIPQTLEMLSGGNGHTGEIGSIEYTRSALSGTQDANPIHVVTGPAGIGKTTFCNNIRKFINSNEKKHVILLSSTDFRGIKVHDSIETVSDLYRISADEQLIDEGESVESQNFEINLSCGNFVLIIDGFDELESNLGGLLNFDKFMESLRSLEECFRRVFVILTVRDQNIDRFKDLNYSTVVRLKGFTTDMTHQYFSRRLPAARISDANRLLSAFQANRSELTTTIPLYASLICDFISDVSSPIEIGSYNGARYFEVGAPLDVLVKKIIDREIVKQSLGAVTPDDFFEILIELIRSPQMSITFETLSEYIRACASPTEAFEARKLLSNPFFYHSGDAIRFKYDSLVHYFKSRFIYRKISDGKFSKSPITEFMSEMYKGDGALFDELRRILPPRIHAKAETTRQWARALIASKDEDLIFCQNKRKSISGLLYWATADDTDKDDRTRTICLYFDGNIWIGIAIFGRFYPLNLTNIIVIAGFLENYTNIVNCEYGDSVGIFNETRIEFDEHSLPEKIERAIFSNDCIIGEQLSRSFNAKEASDSSTIDNVRDNLSRILKTGYRGNAFVWKSIYVYKNTRIVGRLSLDDYLEILIKYGVVVREKSNFGSQNGYRVSKSWSLDAKKLVDENNISGQFMKIVSEIIEY